MATGENGSVEAIFHLVRGRGSKRMVEGSFLMIAIDRSKYNFIDFFFLVRARISDEDSVRIR